MRPPVSTGDLALTAEQATERAVAPFGRLLLAGARSYLGRRGRVLLALDEKRAAPRRVTDLFRYAEAKRVFLPLGAVSMWFVAAGAGEKPSGEPRAFLLPPGCGVVINEGIWHAGPVPLEDASVCEVLETVGTADRFDRRSVRDLADVAALRVMLPEDPQVALSPLDLGAPGAVLLDAAVEGRARLGLLSFEDLTVVREHEALRAELARAGDGLRAMWQHVTNLAEIPGVQAGRETLRALGLDPTRVPPPAEALLAHVLAGKPAIGRDGLDETLALCSLRTRLPLAAYDEAALAAPLLLRAARAGECYEGADEQTVALDGGLVLCDAAGPFGSPLGDARRARPGTATRRALVVAWLPPSADASASRDLLDGVAQAIGTWCGGTLRSRLLVGRP